MASLTNQQIDLTYSGLLKLVDNDVLTGVYKAVTDGEGNETYLQLKTDGVILSDPLYTQGIAVVNTGTLFTGDVDFQTSSVDFTNATVTGLPSANTTYDLGAVGAAGNINMALSGSDGSNDVVTMQAGTNITLTDNGTNTFTIDASGGAAGLTSTSTVLYSTVGNTPVSLSGTETNGVVIGDNVTASGGNGGVLIGADINNNLEGSVVIGYQASNGDIYGTAIGSNARGGYFGVGVGNSANASNFSVAIGGDANTETDYGIAIGYGTQSRADHNISIGHNALVDDAVRVNSVAIGSGGGQTKVAQYSTAVGSQAFAVGAEALALGYNAVANNNGSVALGANVSAVADNTVSMKRLHFTDTVPLNFPDDGTAGANGIPVGGVYHSNGTLKIRIV